MTKQEAEDVRDLASLVYEVILRMGAAYGGPEDWRRDLTTAVKIMERANVAALGAGGAE
jgi:hypothetical protein